MNAFAQRPRMKLATYIDIIAQSCNTGISGYRQEQGVVVLRAGARARGTGHFTEGWYLYTVG